LYPQGYVKADGSERATYLKEIDLPIVDLAKCKELSAVHVNDEQICAGYFDANIDTAAVKTN